MTQFASDGSTITADTVLPSQTGFSGRLLTTNGSASSWGAINVPVSTAKVSGTNRTTTTLSNDMTLSITQTGTYQISGILTPVCVTTNTQGFIFNVNYSGTFSTPAPIIVDGIMNGAAITTVRANVVAAATSGSFSFVNCSTGGSDALTFSGVIAVSTTGTLGLAWAQNSSSANATQLQAPSSFSIVKVA